MQIFESKGLFSFICIMIKELIPRRQKKCTHHSMHTQDVKKWKNLKRPSNLTSLLICLLLHCSTFLSDSRKHQNPTHTQRPSQPAPQRKENVTWARASFFLGASPVDLSSLPVLEGFVPLLEDWHNQQSTIGSNRVLSVTYLYRAKKMIALLLKVTHYIWNFKIVICA